jgi:hypothetical protein
MADEDTVEAQVDALFPRHGPVYCGACRWYARGRATQYGFVLPQCLHPHALVTVESWEGRRLARRLPEERNKYNDCEDWQRRTVLGALWQNPVCMMVIALCVLGLLWHMLHR